MVVAVVVAAAAAERFPILGAGLAFREPWRADVFLHRNQIGFLEITADHYFDVPREKLKELELLSSHFRLVPHALDLSLGSADGIDTSYWKQLVEILRRTGCPWWSEHVAFTRAGELRIGHLAPLPFTREAIDTVCRNIDRVRQDFDLPLALENITWDIPMPGSQMSEPEFLAAILDRTGCGLLLDITNLYTNALNHGFDPLAWLAGIPAGQIVELHLAGGYSSNGRLIDSHSHPVQEPVWRLLDEVLRRAPVKAALIERDDRMPPFAEVQSEVARLASAGRAAGRWN